MIKIAGELCDGKIITKLKSEKELILAAQHPSQRSYFRSGHGG
jgi:hypothetical protein